ncbi:MAG: VWA domain-containing protein [Gemmatimonadaceae bacterium]|nr:VWA domain-containing protein [Gemmatimonadaceae bacterium]
MRFVDRPWGLLAAVAVAVLAFALVRLGHARRRARLLRYGAPEALARLAPPEAALVPTARAWRLGAAALALGVALAGPRWGRATQTLQVEGVDVAIALDLSLSMLADDERPSRLERMKQEVRRLRASSPGDRFALLGFAGRSYILSPLTADDGAIDLFLDNLSPNIVGQAGSAIAPPLRQGIDLLMASRGDADRALVVMSDGEAFDDHQEALVLAAEARDAGISLITVGFGTPGGGTIPLPGTGGADVKRDENGEIVITRYDPTFLSALAKAAEGEFVPADATDKSNRVRRVLAGLETASREEAIRLSRPLRYQWFALVALLLLLLDAAFADGARWPSWLRLRRSSSVAVLLALLFAAPTLHAQVPSLREALEAQRAGRVDEAIRAYRRIVADGDRRPVVLYNLGSALLAADSLDGAVEALERALFTGDPALRTRARYNLGLAYLKRGLRLDGDSRSAALQSARRAFRTVLLETPGDRDAQWNYELALRAPTGGGGGSSTNSPPQGPPQPAPPQPSAMSRQQAEALLDAAAREERDTQARRQRGGTPIRSAGQKDW